MSLHRHIEPIFELSDEHLLIKIPLSQITAEAESEPASPVRVRDAKELAAYLVRYLRKPERSEDIGELLEFAVLHVLEDAAFLGEGVLSIIDDIPRLIDRMWQANRNKILTFYPEGQLNKTPHECLKEAIRAARCCERAAALEWLRRGQDLADEVADVIEANWEEALNYAVARYGPELGDVTDPTDLL